MGRMVIRARSGTDARHLIGGNTCADAAAADRDPSVDLALCERPRKQSHKIRIVVSRISSMGTVINDLMARGSKILLQLPLERKTCMIGSNTNAHDSSPHRFLRGS